MYNSIFQSVHWARICIIIINSIKGNVAVLMIILFCTACLSRAELETYQSWLSSSIYDPNILYEGHLKPSRLAVEPAKPCNDPATAQLNDGAKLKFGCYCGAQHPPIRIPPDVSTDDELKEFHLSKLSNFKPADTLDSFCRRHDLCIAEFGPRVSCDLVLVMQISKYLVTHQNLSGPGYSAAQQRCNLFASHIASVMMTSLAPGEDEEYGNLQEFGLIIGLPVAPLNAANALTIGYPLDGERCN